MSTTIVKGSDFSWLDTVGSQYDNSAIIVRVNKTNYRMKVSEILKFNKPLKDMRFRVVKKRVHEYLEVMED